MLNQNKLRLQARDAIKIALATQCKAFVGIDGFIDEIIHLVDVRQDFENYTRLNKMTEFAAKISEAAGRSGNFERVVQRVKMGGNGPLMSSAMGNLGTEIFYTGAVGWPEVHEIFKPLEVFGRVVTLCEPAHTDAFEFFDGKMLMGKLEVLKTITPERLIECCGGEAALLKELESCQLVALTNWTMVPFATEVFGTLLNLAGKCNHSPLFFFDLADPEKRTKEDLCELIALFSEQSGLGRHVILGLNHNEALQVACAMDFGNVDESEAEEPLCHLAQSIQQASGITEIVVHPRKCSAAATAEGSSYAIAPFTPTPKLSTGAGDHFNGGYAFGRLNGLDPLMSMISGNAVSGHYVRTGHSPTADDLLEFLEKWSRDAVD